MITRIEIDGYKSLKNFSMDIKPGLNVLAGLNGSGKSNILEALEMLSNLGLGNIDNVISNQLKQFGAFFTNSRKKLIMSVSGKDKSKNDYKWNFIIEQGDGHFLYSLHQLEYLPVGGNPVSKSFHNLDRLFDLGELNILFNNSIPINIIYDIMHLKTFDINPAVASQLSPLQTIAKLNRNGEGLIRIIHEMINHKYDGETNKQALLSYFSLLPKAIINLKSDTRPASPDVDLDVTYIFNDQEQVVQVLRTFSYGEITWLALVVTLQYFNSQASLAFDEPDHHLHPDMLRHMVTLFREHAEENGGWVLMTTHNQTVLDMLMPDELKIVENKDGATSVRDIINKDKYEDVMYDSGFGLGWYFKSGIL